jgi:hypothetical protein
MYWLDDEYFVRNLFIEHRTALQSTFQLASMYRAPCLVPNRPLPDSEEVIGLGEAPFLGITLGRLLEAIGTTDRASFRVDHDSMILRTIRSSQQPATGQSLSSGGSFFSKRECR